MDIKTLFECLIIINAVLGAFLFASARVQKAYPGFYYWASSCPLLACAYLLLGLRGVVPAFLSVVVGSTIFALVAVLRLHGLSRFFREEPRPGQFLSAAVVFLLFCFFTFVHDDQVARIVVISAYVDIFIVLSSVVIWRNKSAANAPLYAFMVVVYMLDAVALTARGVSWVVRPQTAGLLQPTFFNISVFVLQMAVDVISTVPHLG
jgi:hypothetical protein